MGLEDATTIPIKIVFGILIVIFIFVLLFKFGQNMMTSIQSLSSKISDFFTGLIPS